MKPFYAALLLPLLAPLTSLSAYAQSGDEQLQYLSEVMAPTVKKKAVYYRQLTGQEGHLYIGKTFTMSGKLKAEGTYLDDGLSLPHGRFTFYHPNGKVESRGEYVNGNKAGIWERFDPWGQPLAEKIYNPEPLYNIVYTRAETMPQYPGGDNKALLRYVKAKVESASDRKVKGSYTTTFIVEKDGTLSDVKVVQGQDQAIGERVAGAIKSSEPWKPGQEKGQPVRVQMRVPVQF
ncbi:MAG: energy transducer TonB [Flavobacteriales bacterium]